MPLYIATEDDVILAVGDDLNELRDRLITLVTASVVCEQMSTREQNTFANSQYTTTFEDMVAAIGEPRADRLIETVQRRFQAIHVERVNDDLPEETTRKHRP